MSSASQDWVAALAEALWPHFRSKLVVELPDQERVDGPAAMNRRQAASYLGMTPNGLRKLRHPLLQARLLPGYSRPLYFRRDLDAWLSLGQQQGKEE